MNDLSKQKLGGPKGSGLLCALLLAAPLSFAEPASRFAEFPAKRAERAKQLADDSRAKRKEAEIWAKTNQAPLRIDTGRQLRELVAIRNGKPLYIKTLNADTAISTAADLVRNTAPYELDGWGLTVGIWDGGSVLTTHQEFSTRISNKEGVASHYHATHVGGTIAASGVESDAKGMAPAVSVDSYYWDDDFSEMILAAASAPGESAIYLSNHSYGYGAGWEDGIFHGFEVFGQYNSYPRDLDQLILDAQYYLPFWAAGNDRTDTGDGSDPGDGEYKNGYDTISYSALAKNVMTVGAVNDAVLSGTRSLANATMSSFSSWGPADDGRIKPDIVANGVGVYSTWNNEYGYGDYCSASGTSMATPNACGSAALLVEYYKKLFNGGAMRASTLKGLIIHTADDLGNAGPDYKFGWGLMNTKAAADLLKDMSENNAERIVEDLLETGNMSDSYTITTSGSEPLRVTLCWTDQPGLSDGTANDDRNADLVNDLDLKIIGPDGVHYPYRLDYSNPSAPATTDSENNVDNVEQVYIENPAPGQYTILVDCDEGLRVYFSSQKGWNFTEQLVAGETQNYSLLISGLSEDADDDGIPNDWELQYFGSATGAVASADSDGDGTDNLTEYISGYSPTNAESVFEVTTFTPPATKGAEVIITWDSVTNRIYNVDWNDNLLSGSFTNISGDLPYPANSYTDRVERTGLQHFYRIDVRLDQ